MSEYLYPAVFQENKDGSYTITYPDLPGCISEGKTMVEAMRMAEEALSQWMEYLEDKAMVIPRASAIGDVMVNADEFVNLIRVEVRDKRAVRRTVSIPKWMDDKVLETGLSLSRVLQEALKERLSPQ